MKGRRRLLWGGGRVLHFPKIDDLGKNLDRDTSLEKIIRILRKIIKRYLKTTIYK